MPMFTVRFAHLAEKSPFRLGQVVRRGDCIGTMGNTGASTAPHVHLDVVRGLQVHRYSLADIEAGAPVADPRQAALFVDRELFGIDPIITTGYADPGYLFARRQLHVGFDVVPVNRHKSVENHGIHWNRSSPGRVIAILEDDPGYGHCISIAFEMEG